MSPQVVKRKLIKFNEYLDQFAEFKKCDYDEFWKDHLRFERLMEVLVMIASDIIFHILSIKNEAPPMTYRTGFLRAGELEILSAELAEKMALIAGMRNIIVHQYENIDYRLLFESIHELNRCFEKFFLEIEELNF